MPSRLKSLTYLDIVMVVELMGRLFAPREGAWDLNIGQMSYEQLVSFYSFSACTEGHSSWTDVGPSLPLSIAVPSL
jgi:hypothetical protein